MSKKLKYGICPKCNKHRQLTRHHIFPRRYFGNGRRNNHCILLCRVCHDALENRIPYSKMPKSFYNKILNEFLRGDELECFVCGSVTHMMFSETLYEGKYVLLCWSCRHKLTRIQGAGYDSHRTSDDSYVPTFLRTNHKKV